MLKGSSASRGCACYRLSQSRPLCYVPCRHVFERLAYLSFNHGDENRAIRNERPQFPKSSSLKIVPNPSDAK